MAVSSTISRKDYTASAGQTVFAYDFYILDQTHIEVYQNSVLKTLTTHYTVSGVGNPAGGNVTLVTGATAGDKITIIRNVPIKQETDYIDASKFPAETHETALDKLTMICQQLSEKIGRAATFAVSSLLTAPVLPDGVIGKFLRWKTTSELENADITGLGAIGVPVSLANGGLGVDASAAAGKATARTNIGLVDGQLRKSLTNRTGGALAANDVVAVSTANDESVVLDDTVASKKKFVVAAGTIADVTAGEFILAGIVTVKSQGTIARGQYVQKSATTKAVEDSGTAMGATTDPPAGALGVALTAAAGNVVTILMLPSGGAAGKPAYVLKPENADLTTSTFPERKRNVGTNWTDYTLDYDQTTVEYVFFTVTLPTGVVFTGASLDVTFRMPSVTTGAVVWEVTTLTRAEGEVWDTAGNVDAFAAETVPGTAGQLAKVTKTLTVTGWAAGETLLIKFARKANDAGDTAAEDAKFMEAVLRLT